MKSLVLGLGILVLLLGGCASRPSSREGAIRVSVYYPQTAGGRFDWDYYVAKHLPLVRARFGPAMTSLSIDEGLAGGAKDSPPAFVAAAHMTFASLESFQAATAPHTPEIIADIPNFTSIVPVIQVSRIKVGR